MWSVLKFWSFPGGLHKPTLQWNTEKWSLACQGGCYPWDRAPFNVPSDGHFGTRKFVFRQLNFIATKMNKRSMGHILTWGKQIISINKSEFIIMLINKRKKPMNWNGSSFKQTWITFTQGCFVQNLFEIGPVEIRKYLIL